MIDPKIQQAITLLTEIIGKPCWIVGPSGFLSECQTSFDGVHLRYEKFYTYNEWGDGDCDELTSVFFDRADAIAESEARKEVERQKELKRRPETLKRLHHEIAKLQAQLEKITEMEDAK